MVNVPERLLVAVLAAMLNVMTPFAEPVAPEVMDSQLALETEVQLQPVVEVTDTLPLLAVFCTERLAVLSPYWQAAAAWVTVTV